jgi:hypothetical protein
MAFSYRRMIWEFDIAVIKLRKYIAIYVLFILLTTLQVDSGSRTALLNFQRKGKNPSPLTGGFLNLRQGPSGLVPQYKELPWIAWTGPRDVLRHVFAWGTVWIGRDGLGPGGSAFGMGPLGWDLME